MSQNVFPLNQFVKLLYNYIIIKHNPPNFAHIFCWTLYSHFLSCSLSFSLKLTLLNPNLIFTIFVSVFLWVIDEITSVLLELSHLNLVPAVCSGCPSLRLWLTPRGDFNYLVSWNLAEKACGDPSGGLNERREGVWGGVRGFRVMEVLYSESGKSENDPCQ